MASGGYFVALVVDNRTSGASIRIDPPTASVQTSVDVPTSVGFPATIGVNEEVQLLCTFYAGFFNNAEIDNLVMPVSLTSSGTTVSGTIRMYTAGGEHFPDYVITDLDVGGMRSTTQLPTSGLDVVGAATSGGAGTQVGTLTLVFSDLGANTAIQEANSYMIDALKLVVTAIPK
jgi:hypothetical protein